MILVGDIGGTNARLALYTSDAGRLIREEVLPSAAHKTFSSAVRTFLGEKRPKLTAATFGIAGPVIDGRVKTTNLPWVIDERTLSKELGVHRVTLINDLVALGLGAIAAKRKDLHLLSGKKAPGSVPGTVAVIAAGTGLGEAMLVWNGEGFVPCGSEGGHVDFAPRSALEWELRDFVAKRVGGRVSYERVLSGPGLGTLYDFFRVARGGIFESEEDSHAILASTDRNATIAEFGASGRSRACVAALELFASLYGAEAGNLALKGLAVGGVFLAGKIAWAIAPVLERAFMPAFIDKGRMKPVLERMPVAIVKSASIGLQGAARHAARLV